MEEKSLVLCDTNIIIDFYKEHPDTLKKLQAIGQNSIAISIVTAGELLFGALNKEEYQQIRQDIAHLHLLHLDPAIDECFMDLMDTYSLSHNLSLPDGLIAATAIVEDIPLYTRNKKDFRYIEELKLYQT
ncbi:type II toxin-antitoxin system VapC family toxin [Fodinibius salsisoli]|uniref:Ribonuclease VapC n=1 Tax=Fodinibius salsisoli TaxID=2820877 RepID=A0ABT3PTD5_9BACT|nr:type II toxin-antitoxin system VapC family toxin [Fodinibius salsisoli]MCW9709120.1 type II toxin-antitoxin system VapC family toxin [Fodinibius salsisoli]